MSCNFLGKKISGVFTIPSGIITTDVKVIEKIANEIPEIGILTTKSIGLEPREGNREPILTQYSPGCFINAVGLTNLGAEEFAKQLAAINIPKDRFLLISIFGKDADEFIKTAKILEPLAGGLELNFSCPHAAGYGAAIGQNSDLVKEITLAVKRAVNVPVVPKLTPNVSNLTEIALAAVQGGADAICAINTAGPGYFTVDGNSVLTNKKGGMSGRGIFALGLKSVQEISQAVNIPIIACGGIGSADDVRAYQQTGASILGVGSALAGLTTEELKIFFRCLNHDLEKGTDNAADLLKPADMNFKKYRLVENRKLADDLSLLIFDRSVRIKPGQFVFVWIPGIGEKPFSVLDDNPLTLAVQKRGCFTAELANLTKEREIFLRGPYGQPIEAKGDSKIILVAGGCGLAALFQIARDFKNGRTEAFVGARDKNHLFYIKKLRAFAEVNLATDDGSQGYPGRVTELLKEKLEKLKDFKGEKLIFFNCGPKEMIETAAAIEREYVSPDKIHNSIEYLTKCGVGLCGSCADKNGKRLCVDGPFMN